MLLLAVIHTFFFVYKRSVYFDFFSFFFLNKQFLSLALVMVTFEISELRLKVCDLLANIFLYDARVFLSRLFNFLREHLNHFQCGECQQNIIQSFPSFAYCHCKEINTYLVQLLTYSVNQARFLTLKTYIFFAKL